MPVKRDAEHALPFLIAQLHNRGDRLADAGVVDQDVQPATSRGDLLEAGRHAGAVGDVQRDGFSREALAGEYRRGLGCLGVLHVRQHHGRPTPGQRRRYPQAKSLGRTRHHRDLTLKRAGHECSSSCQTNRGWRLLHDNREIAPAPVAP